MTTMRLFLLIIGAVCLLAQGTFVYTNNNIAGANNVSAFSAGANGALTPITGSPFATAGTGTSGGFFASNRITSAAVKDFLYVANTGSNNVSAFSINSSTGNLTVMSGSPFPTGGTAGGVGICSAPVLCGLSLAATPDDKFLIAANGGSINITVYSIAANGALTPVAGSPFSAGGFAPLDGIKVTPDGKFLAVARLPEPENGTGSVSMFSITATGGLIPVPGSPFPAAGGVAGVDCNCASTQLYAGEAVNSLTRVDAFSIASNGVLTPVAGSPFTGPGVNSNVVVLSPDDKSLFVSNQFSNTITVFSVAANGTLSLVAGSPFAAPGITFPSGLATNAVGTFLYVTGANNTVGAFSIAANGALTPVPSEPFPTVSGSGLESLTVFPPKNCCPAPVITGASATPNVLRPPNRKLVDVTIDYTVTDRCPNNCKLSVSSSESVNGSSEGNTSSDWEVIDSHHLVLRAERAGNGDGRIYTITITCMNDTNKLSSTHTVTVSVPHDQSQ